MDGRCCLGKKEGDFPSHSSQLLAVEGSAAHNHPHTSHTYHPLTLSPEVEGEGTARFLSLLSSSLLDDVHMECRKVALVVCATARDRTIYLLDSPQHYNINRLRRSILGWVSHTTDRGAWSLSCDAGHLAYLPPPWPAAFCGHSALDIGGTRIRPHPPHSLAGLPPQAYGLLNVCWELYFLSINILPVSRSITLCSNCHKKKMEGAPFLMI